MRTGSRVWGKLPLNPEPKAEKQAEKTAHTYAR